VRDEDDEVRLARELDRARGRRPVRERRALVVLARVVEKIAEWGIEGRGEGVDRGLHGPDVGPDLRDHAATTRARSRVVEVAARGGVEVATGPTGVPERHDTEADAVHVVEQEVDHVLGDLHLRLLAGRVSPANPD